ncbi:hypothetical protein JTE90_009961 [Oedothorax gibbosus]|uniref:Major facilitator superfamily (MFS) profile domain-containing protein n=1 Tax=Oedothorax gibbosus TaxID=931172 RepID=A0AAV6V8W2_9ARAC|nr:hypothetical protein JTE90_009961 [Oedothorax gibbosus]
MESVWVTLFVCVACYAYNRKSVSFVSPKLIEDGLDRSHAGLILSCQNGAFALSKFIVGVLSDKTNPRHVFIFGLLLSAAATLAFSSAPVTSISVLCGLWSLNGLAQGCGWPSCAKIIRQKASPSQFGTLWSVLSSGNNFSGSLSPFISSYIVLHYGWRTSVFSAGCASVVLGILGAAALKYSLGTDENSNKEHEKSTQQKSSKEGKDAADGSLIDLLLDPFLIMVSAGYFMVFCARSVLLDWGQLYLIEDRGRSHHEGSAFASSLETGGFLGQIAAGFITDKLINLFTGSSQSSVRLSVAVVSMLGSVSLLHALQVTVTEESSTAWITSLGFALGASLYGPIAIFGIVSTESAPAHLSGKSNAVAALAANLGAMTSGFPCCYLAKHYSWSTVFFILEVTTGVLLLIIFCFRNLQPKLLQKEAQKKEK